MAWCVVVMPDNVTVPTALIRLESLPLPDGSDMPCGMKCWLRMGHARLTC